MCTILRSLLRYSAWLFRIWGLRLADSEHLTIDADGILQEEHIGDASIEGKLKKLLAHARELQSTENPPK